MRLRLAAAIVYGVPGVTVRVRARGVVVVEVGWGGVNRSHPAVRWLPPAAFRATIADAWERTASGNAVAVLGLRPGAAADVELLTVSPATTEPLGVVGAMVGGRAVWIVPTVAPPDTVDHVLGRLGDEMAAGPGSPARVCRVRDEAVGVSLLVVERSRGDGGCSAAARRLAEELVVRCAMAACDRELAALLGAEAG